mgnify:CR=1 FL=1
MDKETGQEYHVWLSRKDVINLTYDEIVDKLIEEAIKDDYEPYDMNWRDRPNIYFRGKYKYNDEDGKLLIDDGFMMFVKKVRK